MAIVTSLLSYYSVLRHATVAAYHHPRFGVLLAPQDEVCRCLWWCAAATASSVFDVAGGDVAEVAVEVSVAGSQLCDG